MKAHPYLAWLMLVCSAALAATVLTGCGVEAVGSAATGAAIKKQEVEQAQAQKQAVHQQLQQALDQGQQRH